MSEIEKVKKLAAWMNRVLVAVAIGFMILLGVLSINIPYDGMLQWTGLLYISGAVSGISIVAGFWIRSSLIPSLGLSQTIKGMGIHTIWMSTIVGLHEASGLLWAICAFLYQEPDALAGTGLHILLIAMLWNAGNDLEQFSSPADSENQHEQ